MTSTSKLIAAGALLLALSACSSAKIPVTASTTKPVAAVSSTVAEGKCADVAREGASIPKDPADAGCLDVQGSIVFPAHRIALMDAFVRRRRRLGYFWGYARDVAHHSKPETDAAYNEAYSTCSGG